MAQTNVLKRFLDAGMSFTEMTQSKAEALVKELVKAGEVQTEHAQALVSDLVERSRRNTEALIDQVRHEVTSSADAWGLATIADLDRVEKLIQSVLPSKKTSAREPAAEKAPAKKAPAKKTAAKKTAAKKTAAKKTAAKKTAAKKTAG
jgi:polyhydroxyalkanoate synthesis regulator phasin